MKNFKLNISRAKFSSWDKKRRICIPKALTSDVASLDGIVRSDGSVFFGQDHHNDLIIFGHFPDDLPFFKYYVASLITKVHGNAPIKFHKYASSGNCLHIELHSKAIASFWNRVMNIPNDKLDFKLHSRIIKNRDLAILNLRGYFDGDGTINFSPGTRRFSPNPVKINYYPLISWSTESKMVANQIKQILIDLKFRPFILKHIEKKGGRMGYTIRVGGRMDYEKFVGTINSNNPNHLTKILIYEIFGYCPPNTTLQDRIKILKKEKSPAEFYKTKPKKIKSMIIKENEEKVLKILLKSPSYPAKMAKETNLKCISFVLKRLEKFEQIRYLGFKKGGDGYRKRFYEITSFGRERLNRIPVLFEMLKNKFHLDIT